MIGDALDFCQQALKALRHLGQVGDDPGQRNETAARLAGVAAPPEIPFEEARLPPMAASFPLVMLAGTDAGDAYTFSEYEKMFRNAGFAKTTFHPIPDLPQQALVSEKSS